MVCGTSCSIAIAFIVCMIYFYTATYTSGVAKKYLASLPAEKKQIYETIVQERASLSYQGYAAGLLLSAFALWIYEFNKIKLSNTSKVCLVVATTFVTNYFYYMISDKKDYMLYHLKGEKEVKQWVEMYRAMQKNYHLGFAFGIAAAGLATWAFRC